MRQFLNRVALSTTLALSLVAGASAQQANQGDLFVQPDVAPAGATAPAGTVAEAASAPAAALRTEAPSAGIGAVYAAMPAGATFAFAARLRPGTNTTSFLNYVPMTELMALAEAEAIKDSPDKAEIIKSAFPALNKVETFGVAVYGDLASFQQGEQEPPMVIVGTGSFTAAEMGAIAVASGGQAATETTPGMIPSQSGDNSNANYIVPKPGVVVMYNDTADTRFPGRIASVTTGAAPSMATALASLLGTDAADPDAALLIDMNLVRQAMAQEPSLGLFALPLQTSTAGGLLLLHGPTEGSLELRLAYPDPQNAQFGTQFLQQLVLMLQQQGAAMIPMLAAMGGETDPAKVQEAQAKLTEGMAKIAASQRGSTAILRVPIDKSNLPAPEDARAQILQKVRESQAAQGMAPLGRMGIPVPGAAPGGAPAGLPGAPERPSRR
jgi:hypothetical protein